jgi:hypothetical protein
VSYDAEEMWVRGRLTAWTTCPVLWDNEKGDVAGTHLRVRIVHGPSQQADMGNPDAPRDRYFGSVIVEVRVLAGQGTKESNQLCDAVATVFRRARGAGILFRTPQRIPVGAQGGFYRQDVLCPFTRDTITTA